MNNLEAVVKRAKRDIAHKYVYVMMPIPQLQVLIDGLEALQEYADDEGMRVSDAIAERDGWEREVERLSAELSQLQREVEEKDDALSYAMNQIQIKESHIRKMEGSHAAS